MSNGQPTNGDVYGQIADVRSHVAVLGNEYKRLESAVVQQGTKLDAVAAQMSANLDKMATGLTGDIKTLATTLQTRSQTNWPLFLTLIGMAFTIITGSLTGGWYIIGLQSENSILNAVNPVQQEVASGAKERQALGERIQRISEMVSGIRESVAALDAGLGQKLVEIETQFWGIDQINNLERIDELRHRALIWPKLFKGERYPEMFYAPSMAQRDPQPHVPSAKLK